MVPCMSALELRIPPNPPFCENLQPHPIPRTLQRRENFWLVSSPKLGRMVELCGNSQKDTWLALVESQWDVTSFCERPNFSRQQPPPLRPDFLLRRIDLAGARDAPVGQILSFGSPKQSEAAERAMHEWCAQIGCSFRQTNAGELEQLACWRNNWRNILSFVPLKVDPHQLQECREICGQVGRGPVEAFEASLRKRLGKCPTSIRGLLFALLHRGELKAPSLKDEPFNLATLLSFST